MVIAIIGESCAGKSTLAEKLRESIAAELVTGKDYLRLAKSEREAEEKFRAKLAAVQDNEHVIYVISEPEQIALLPEGAIRILVTAELDTIKERFRERMHGNLPRPVEQMLERKHGLFDSGTYAIRYHSDREDLQTVCSAIQRLLGAE